MEAQLDVATQDYEYLNGLLKEELPRLLQLRTQLIDPMFENFYFTQCQIYSMLLARLQEVINTNGDHFETINMGIEEGFNQRLNRYNARTELEESGLLKQGGRAWLGGKFNGHVDRIGYHQIPWKVFVNNYCLPQHLQQILQN